MTKPIGFHVATGALVIMGNGEFPAASLIAYPDQSPSREGWIQIDTIADRGAQSVRWQDVTSLDGTFTPQSMADALAYLQGEFAKRSAVGETFGVAAVAGADLIRGTPVAISRQNGHLLPARADTYTLSFVAGLASADTSQGFTDQPAHGAVTLDDWTAIAGTAALAVGQPYFLGPAGGLTLIADHVTAACVVRVGLATAPTTLVVQPNDPILL